MLISAGLITGTRTATVPQAQTGPTDSALKTTFFMVLFPRGAWASCALSIASIGVAVGSNSLTTFWTVAACGDSKEGHPSAGDPHAQFPHLCGAARGDSRGLRAAAERPAHRRHRRGDSARQRRPGPGVGHERRADRAA